MLFQAPELSDREAGTLGHIEELQRRAALYTRETRRWTGSLGRITRARNIRGSNSIEGYDAVLDDAAAIADGAEPLDASDATRLALMGYQNAMTYVLQVASDDKAEYSTQLIKSLHFMMTSYDIDVRPGLWRAGSIFVRDDRTGETVYQGADLELVDALMVELAESLNSVSEPPIIAAAMAHLNLVKIHPFRDGNGRMARCLQCLVLAVEGQSRAPEFLSIEEFLGRNTETYYDVLSTLGGSSWQPNRDARPWIRFVLRAHLRQAHTVLERVRLSERLWERLEALVGPGNDRYIVGLYDAAVGLRVRRATYVTSVASTLGEPISDQTATRDLAAMVASGYLQAHGEKRGRFYVATEPVRRIYVAAKREAAAALTLPADL